MIDKVLCSVNAIWCLTDPAYRELPSPACFAPRSERQRLVAVMELSDALLHVGLRGVKLERCYTTHGDERQVS